MEVSGKITIKGNLNGRIGQEKPIKGQVGYAQTKLLPWYEGEYEVTPKWEDITLNTKQKSMRGGAVLPSFLIILAIATVFAEWKEQPAVEAAFKGIRPAVVALIAAPLVKMARAAKISWLTLLIPIAAALLIWLGHVNPVWVIFATIIITLVIVDIVERRRK